MKPPCMELGSVSNEMLTQDWVLIFGGLELNSVAQAAEAVKVALEKNDQVVFFNPKEEQIDNYLSVDFSQEYKSYGNKGTKFTTIDCFNEFQEKPLSKYVDILNGSLNGVESPQVGYQSIFLQILPLSLRRVMSAVLSKVYKACLGFIFWGVVKEQILKISGGTQPKTILYCDEDSIAPAWNAGQIWKNAEVRACWEVF
tara:strand:+ start:1050 stop:1646 length:597 start_codon:yes stop_codon:yes gene_type:complete